MHLSCSLEIETYLNLSGIFRGAYLDINCLILVLLYIIETKEQISKYSSLVRLEFFRVRVFFLVYRFFKLIMPIYTYGRWTKVFVTFENSIDFNVFSC